MVSVRFGLRLALWLSVLFPINLFSQGKIAFDETSHSFGPIKEEAGKVRYKFSFRNEGKGKLVVKDVKPSCGCTTVDFSKDSLLPDAHGYIIVQYDPMHRPGKFDKSVVVETNGSPDQVILKISGVVVPRAKEPKDFYPFKDGLLRFKTNHLVFGKILNSEIKSLSTIIYNESPRPMLLDLEKTDAALGKHLRLKSTKKSLLPGDTATITVFYYANLKKDWGFCFESFILFTNDASKPMKKVNVSAEITEKFEKDDFVNPPKAVLDKTTHDFGTQLESENPVGIFILTNTGKSPLLLHKVLEYCPCTKARIEKSELEPGESANIIIEFTLSGRTGQQEKELKVITNDPYNPVQTIMVKAMIKAD